MDEICKTLHAVDPDLLLIVEQYALETGQTTASCINEALSDWIEDSARPRLEILRRPVPVLTIRMAVNTPELYPLPQNI